MGEHKPTHTTSYKVNRNRRFKSQKKNGKVGFQGVYICYMCMLLVMTLRCGSRCHPWFSRFFSVRVLGDIFGELYLRTDVLLLPDIFENFAELCLE